MELEKTVMVLKVKNDKASLKTMAYQVAQIATQCTKHNVEIVDCVVTFGGVKDILRELGKCDEKMRFDSVICYSPSQICKDPQEYNAFVSEVQSRYQVGVRYLRSKA